jgi:hypothetical protein
MATGGVAGSGRHSSQGTLAPAPPPPPGPVVSGGDSRESRRTQYGVAVISAVATIAAAAIAGILAVNSGAVHVSLTDPAAEVDDLRATATSLERENDTLSEENDEFQAQVDATAGGDDAAGGTPVVTSGPETPTSSVRRQTGSEPLTFTWAYSVDLDSVDADWAVEYGSESGWDLYLDGDGDVATLDVVLFDHVPTEAECRDATVRQTQLEDVQSVVGAMMCVLTTEDRFAFVRIAAIDEERRTTSVDLVVWE